MRSREKQGDFNKNLMQSLERIENKLDKESGSRKFASHRSPNDKTRTRSVRRHHQHSLVISIREKTLAQVHPM
jgi:hypothetical protein